jgi:subtilisin family serine protease
VLLLGACLGSAIAQQDFTKVEPQLFDKIAKEGSANFFVRMSAQADLSPAYGIADWGERGRYVHDELKRVALESQAAVIEYAREHGLDHTSFLTTNAVFIRGGNLQALFDLAAIPGVEVLREERILTINDTFVHEPSDPKMTPMAITDWGITDTKANQVWSDFGARGAGIKVANIDTGVQWNHPGLVNQFACPGTPANAACWRDPSNVCGAAGACDGNGHGTHTMGSMVSKDDPGLPYIAGMAPDATWIACLGCESFSCSEFALNTCADWILAPGGDSNNRPDIVNNSWAGGGGDTWYLAKVNAWRASGIFPAFAAANNYSCNSLGSPGDYQESFGSASHRSSRAISDFSSKGPSAFGDDPYTKPNLSAPGESICSTVPTNAWSCGYSGTSMASPHTAGAVALIWSACPEYRNQIDLTFQLLQDTADIPSSGACGGPADGQGNYTFGYGYLNALLAVQMCSGAGGAPVHVDSITLVGGTQGRKYVVTGTVVVKDENGVVLPGADVTAAITIPSGQTRTFTSATDANGVATFSGRAKRGGTWQLCVSGIFKSGYLYSPGDNVETCDTLVFP